MSGQPTTLQDVIDGGLCVGCGICTSLAPAQLTMTLSDRGDLRPQFAEPLSPEQNALLVDVCPGATAIGPDPATLEAGTTLDPIWGPLRGMQRGWAADPQVRFTAAAGGVLTALGQFLLDSGRVTAVLHVRTSPTQPMLTDAHISRPGDSTLVAAQSRYGPAAPLVHVQQLLDAGERFAVIGKPCDVTAIRNLARHDVRVETQIPYLLTIFCGGVPNVTTAESIAKAHGIEPDEVTLFRFRGEGWPGPTRVEAGDQRFDITYRQAWFDRDAPWRYDAQWRCKICPDAIGEVADVSVPDGWILDADGKTTHNEAPGVNIVVERTATGSELVAAAIAAGYLETAECSYEDFELMHHDHHNRRLGEPARLAALKEAGTGEPRVEHYRLEEMGELAPADLLATQFEGTLDRIARGQAVL